MSEISQSRIKEMLDYDSKNGVFIWLKSPSTFVKKGSVAGGLCHSNGYITIGIDGKRYVVQKLAWLYVHGHLPEGELDHINHNKEDNSIGNLREVSHQGNMKNRSMNGNNSSGFNGVFWSNCVRKWKAEIRFGGKKVHLGTFKDIDAAIIARKAANIKYGYHENHGA